MSQEMNPSKAYFKLIKEPTESMAEYYVKMFRRNQMKFIRRSSLDVDHLGSEFSYEGLNLRILGASDTSTMVVKDIDNDKYYLIHSDIVTNSILINN
jgi:hypothetical protein